MMKKRFALGTGLVLAVCALTGCGSMDKSSISVISREDGSGTRSAFVELIGVEEKDADGNKIDRTISTAEVTSSTAVMMTTVAGNKNAIGYISLGSYNNSVTAVEIDGVEASAENVKNGTYALARPFNIATKSDLSAEAQDFITFILSENGQIIVENAGYVSEGNTGAYSSSVSSGTITIAGSSSVAPVMEQLKEAYIGINPNVTISIQQNDSSTGMTSAAEGVCDIGMASRALKDSEIANGLTATAIAMDGIAVIVNNDNVCKEMTSEQICAIYTGEITTWTELEG